MSEIADIIEQVKENICDNYCKYPDQYESNETMIEEQCEKCPLCRL